jgi:hypothetical protein
MGTKQTGNRKRKEYPKGRKDPDHNMTKQTKQTKREKEGSSAKFMRRIKQNQTKQNRNVMNNYSNLQQKEQKPTAAEDKISFLSSHIFLDQQQQQTSTIKKKSVGLSGLPLMLARTHR